MSNHTHPKLGVIIDGDIPNRDAIHVAVAPAIANVDIKPGTKVYVDPLTGRATPALSASTTVGIADPFLRSKILAGERFWVMVTPNTVTDLRHHWTHPSFPDVPPPPEEEEEMEYDGCLGC